MIVDFLDFLWGVVTSDVVGVLVLTIILTDAVADLLRYVDHSVAFRLDEDVWEGVDTFEEKRIWFARKNESRQLRDKYFLEVRGSVVLVALLVYLYFVS